MCNFLCTKMSFERMLLRSLPTKYIFLATIHSFLLLILIFCFVFTVQWNVYLWPCRQFAQTSMNEHVCVCSQPVQYKHKCVCVCVCYFRLHPGLKSYSIQIFLFMNRFRPPPHEDTQFNIFLCHTFNRFFFRSTFRFARLPFSLWGVSSPPLPIPPAQAFTSERTAHY